MFGRQIYCQVSFICLLVLSFFTDHILLVYDQRNHTLGSAEQVPFRLTPNMQSFMTASGLEGIFATSLMSIARSLTEPEYDLENFLHLFIRDLLITWNPVPPRYSEQQIKDIVIHNVDLMIQRADRIACKVDSKVRVVFILFFRYLTRQQSSSPLPVHQTILDLIAQATNPTKLANMDILWMPFL